jgi:rhamnulokinase
MAPRVFAAVDLGASSGRVAAGVVDDGSLTLDVVHRFPNGPIERDGHLRWPMSRLYREVLGGLARLATAYPEVESVGIDTWGVDYALLDADGGLLAEPVCYRDERTDKVVDAVHERVGPDELWARTGLQFLPFTTIYQLEAERRGPLWPRAASLLLLPDLVAFWLTGERRTERTNASTTGLLDVHRAEWSGEVTGRLGLREGLLAPLVSPGTVVGPLLPAVRDRLGLRDGVVVTAVGSHDTASAVAALPAAGRRFAYASSGTWSLVGVERFEPVLTAAARQANFTNELGVGGRTRFLRNTGGFWLLEESLRTWSSEGRPQDLETVLSAAAALPAGGPVIDVDDPSFLAPGPMPARIAAVAEAAGSPPPTSPPEVVRCVVDSLARAYAVAARRAATLSGTDVDVLHIVGGGSNNALLCQGAADAAGLPVVAGPAEATAVGNVLVQARAHDAVTGSLEEARSVAATNMELRRYEPQ